MTTKANCKHVRIWSGPYREQTAPCRYMVTISTLRPLNATEVFRALAKAGIFVDEFKTTAEPVR